MLTVKIRTTFTVFSLMTCTQSFLFQLWFLGSCRNGDAKLNVTIFQATVDAKVYPSLCSFFVWIFNICGKMTLNIHSNVCMHTNEIPFCRENTSDKWIFMNVSNPCCSVNNSHCVSKTRVTYCAWRSAVAALLVCCSCVAPSVQSQCNLQTLSRSAFFQNCPSFE